MYTSSCHTGCSTTKPKRSGFLCRWHGCYCCVDKENERVVVRWIRLDDNVEKGGDNNKEWKEKKNDLYIIMQLSLFRYIRSFIETFCSVLWKNFSRYSPCIVYSHRQSTLGNTPHHVHMLMTHTTITITITIIHPIQCILAISSFNSRRNEKERGLFWYLLME